MTLRELAKLILNMVAEHPELTDCPVLIETESGLVNKFMLYDDCFKVGDGSRYVGISIG